MEHRLLGEVCSGGGEQGEFWAKGTLLHCGWECKSVQPLWRTVCRFLKNLGIKLPYDPAILLLDMYPEKIIIQKDTYLLGSLQHYLQWPGHGSNLNVHKQKNG